MKKIIAGFCAAAMLFSLAACAQQADYSGQTVTGQVTAIDGTSITLQLGEMGQQNAGMQGNQFETMGQTGETGSDQAMLELPNEAPQKDDQNSSELTSSETEQVSGQTPPEMPGGAQQGDAQTPPEMPGSAQQGDAQTPPENPDGTQRADGQAPPDLPSGEMPQGGQPESGTPPEKPDGEMPGGNDPMGGFQADGETITLDFENATIQVESGSETTDGTLENIEIGSVLIVEVGAENMAKTATVKAAGFMGMPGGQQGGFGGSGTVSQGTSSNTISEDGEYSGETYTSTGDDENALRVDGATVVLDGITVDKSAGLSSNTEDGDFYGMNAALLATNGATVTIQNATVTSSAQNGNGVFNYGSGTTVNISDSKITTTADNSGGIQTTGGGTTNATNLTIKTSGNSAAAIRSDRGGGTVNVDSGSYTTNGYNSPAVYSTAAISVKDAVLTANNSEALVIEGKNSIALENCTVTGNMSDTKGTSSDENVHNVMIYQSMSGDADVGTSSFTMSGGALTAKNGDMFYVTNTHCIIQLSGVEIDNQDSDGYLLRVAGNSASRGWGTAGKNGGQVELTAANQALEGNILVDSISTLQMTLSENSNFTGTINIADNAQGGTAVTDNAVITIDSGSTWTLTGDCTITSLTNNGTINYNGYTVTLADGTVLQ